MLTRWHCGITESLQVMIHIPSLFLSDFKPVYWSGDWYMASEKIYEMLSDSNIVFEVWVNLISGFVPGSAKLTFQGIYSLEDMLFVAN